MHMLADDTELALDVLADMIQNSTMPDNEIESERHVILQEIGMCHDTPDDVIFDNYYETAYADQTLGAPILGTADIISNMKREVLQAYVQNHYTPENIIISAAGNVNHEKFVALTEKYFNILPAGQKAEKQAATYTGGEIRIEKDLEQSHVIIGFQGVSRLSPDFYAAQALSALFGGGMSSRLFQEIREKRGLVYSIFSFHSSYSDDGQFGIYAGTGPNDLKELVPVVCEEILKLADTLTEEEVVRAKTQIRSSLIMGRESMMTRADQQAKYLIFRDKKLDIEEIIAQIDALNKEKISAVARQIFASKPTMSSLGPLTNLESYEAIQRCLDVKKAA